MKKANSFNEEVHKNEAKDDDVVVNGFSVESPEPKIKSAGHL